jgi:phage gp46-like protein
MKTTYNTEKNIFEHTSGAPNHQEKIETLIINTLFTDRRADDDDIIPDGYGIKRGWWGDTFSDKKTGSKLWLLKREKQMNSVVLKTKNYAYEALKPLVEDGIIRKLTIEAYIPKNGVLGLIIKPDEKIFTYEL